MWEVKAWLSAIAGQIFAKVTFEKKILWRVFSSNTVEESSFYGQEFMARTLFWLIDVGGQN